MTTFGSTLQRLRTDRGLSQQQLATRAGYDHSFPSRLESGTRNPTRECVVKLADALGLDGRDRSELFLSALFVPDTSGVWIPELRFETYGKARA